MTRIDRIRTEHHVDAMVALDTFELLTARIRKLLSWGRRISITQRYTYTDRPPELEVGLTLDVEAHKGGFSEGGNDDGRHFGVNLKPGLTAGFGFSAYVSNGNATEKEAWKRHHDAKDGTDHWSKRRNMTMVTLVGGLEGDTGPARDDLIVIRAWNDHGVCDERVIGFDTAAYWAERKAIPTGLDARPVLRYTVHCSQCGRAAPTYEWDSVTAIWESDDLAKLGSYALDDLGWKTNDGLTDPDLEGRALVCPECWQVGWCETCDSPVHAWQEAVDEPTDRTMWHQTCGAPEPEATAEAGGSR